MPMEPSHEAKAVAGVRVVRAVPAHLPMYGVTSKHDVRRQLRCATGVIVRHFPGFVVMAWENRIGALQGLASMASHLHAMVVIRVAGSPVAALSCPKLPIFPAKALVPIVVGRIRSQCCEKALRSAIIRRRAVELFLVLNRRIGSLEAECIVFVLDCVARALQWIYGPEGGLWEILDQPGAVNSATNHGRALCTLNPEP